MARPRRAMVSYNGGSDTDSATRSQMVALNPVYIDGPRVNDAIYYRQNSPQSRILQYLTISDVSVDDRLAFLLAQAAGEGALRHFYNDTTVNLVGVGDVRVKGYGGPFGTAATLAEARIPVYNGTRYLTNFGSALARTAHENYAKTILQTPFASGMFYDGIWHDNACFQTFNVEIASLDGDTRLSGRRVWGQYVKTGTGAWAATGTYYYKVVPMVSATEEGVASPSFALTITSKTSQYVELDWDSTGNGTYRIYRNTSDTWTSGNLLRGTFVHVPGQPDQFIDNGGPCTAGVPHGAGIIAENTAVTFKSRGYNDWHWYQGMGLYLQDMKRYCDTRPNELGNRQTYIVANVANSPSIGTTQWKNNYVDFSDTSPDPNGPPAHCLFMEFQFSPIRNDGVDIPMSIYNQAEACRAAGVDFWCTGFAGSMLYPYVGSTLDNNTAGFTVPNTGNADTLTAFEVMMGIVSQYSVFAGSTCMIVGYPHSWVPHAQDNPPPNASGFGSWQYNTIGLWNVDLGTPVGAPVEMATGTDPRGYTYKIHKRTYTNGLAVVRNRGGDTQRCDATGAVTVDLPAGTWKRVTDCDGTVSGSASTTVTLKNGEGALFVSGTPVTPDTTPPTDIADLNVEGWTDTTVTFTWTEPTDAVGVTGYDMRYSTSSITNDNFNAALATTPQPVLGDDAGFAVMGLAPGTTYYFAIKSRDAAGNWSGISNMRSAVTDPAAISGMTATVVPHSANNTQAQVRLDWLAPTGSPVSYDFRFREVPITDLNWDDSPSTSAGGAPAPPTPAGAGVAQSYTADPPFLPMATVYIACKSMDASGNISALSNVVSALIPDDSLVDVLPPDQITTLAVTGVTSSTVSLSWLSVLDNSAGGAKTPAMSYDLRYAPFPINNGNWGSATPVVGENIPHQTAGFLETFVVTGLQPGTTYYFGLKTTDFYGNVSGLSNVQSKTTNASAPPPPPFVSVPQSIIRGRVATIPVRPDANAPALIGAFPQYANLYWNNKWGASNDTTPGRDSILRALANHKVVILDEQVTNPLTTATNDFGIEDAASRLKAMNSGILVGINCNSWSTNENGTSIYWPFRTKLYKACLDNDWFLKFTNNSGGIVYSDGNTNLYRMIDITNPAMRQWFAENIRRYFMHGGFDQYDFLFFDEMQNSLAAVPTQSGGASWEIALFNGSLTTRTRLMSSSGDTAGRAAQDAAWTAANAALCALLPDVLLMPNGTQPPAPNMIGRMVQGIYPSTKPDNEWPTIQSHFRNTKRSNRLMFIHSEWGSAIPQWLQNVGLTDQQMIDMGCVRIVNGSIEYLAQGSWLTYQAAAKDLAAMASIMDGVGQLEPKLSGHFKQPWQYFGYAPGAFGRPEEYIDGSGNECPRIYTEKINASGGTFGSGIYYRKFEKAIVAFNWQYDVGGVGVALTWSLSGQSIAKNKHAIIWR